MTFNLVSVERNVVNVFYRREGVRLLVFMQNL